jgi:hypothetical protein
MFTLLREASFMGLESISKTSKRLASFGLGAIIGLMPYAANAEYVSISSVPETSQVQPGQVYKLRVVADSTYIPNDTIIAASWYIYVPAGITIAGAELPSLNNPSTNPNDFFYGVTMKSNMNFVDSSVDSSGQLTDNVRGCHVWDGGTKNRTGDLGWYYFAADSSLIGQTLSFNLNHVYVLNSYTNNVAVNITDSQFTVIPEPATLLLISFGGVMLRRKR